MMKPMVLCSINPRTPLQSITIMAPAPTSRHPLLIFYRLFFIWATIVLLPLRLLARFFPFLNPCVAYLLTESGLTHHYLTLKSSLSFAKNWFLGVFRILLRHSARLKYPFGYAMLKKNGKYINGTNEYSFVIQLYDYLARKFIHLRNLATLSVMEVEPTTEGGLEYLASTLKAAHCLGVTTDEISFRSLKRNSINPRVKFLCSPELNSSEIKPSSFDCVIAVNVLSKVNVEGKSPSINDILLAMKKALKPSGYICLAEYLPVDQISFFEYCLKNAGLRIAKTQNLSNNLSYAIKLQAKHEMNESLLQKIRRVLGELLQEENIHIDILSELQMRRQFIAYILQPQSTSD